MSNKIQLYTVYFICKLLYTFRVVSRPIIGSTSNCIYLCPWWWVDKPPETFRAVYR